MPKTLLAVDDSATMRKVLDITFSGEDFRVVTAEGRDAALGKLSEAPEVVVIDSTLGGGDEGYGLAADIRKKDPRAVIILLASRYNPYDQAKGKDAGADDFMDKPFDTQQMIDKVRKALLTREGGAGVQPAAAAPAPAPAIPKAVATTPFGGTAGPAAVVGGAPPPRQTRQPTLMFGGDPSAAPGAAKMPDPNARPALPHPPAASAAAPAQRPAAPVPAPAHVPAAAPVVSSAGAGGAGVSVAHAVNGGMHGKLGELGLTPQQAEAVMALSREVVERVVWEVVPQLAEAIIKEEIARLTREA